MPASLLTTPLELLEHIVLFAVRDTARGPPSVLRALRLTCRTMNQALSVEQNPHLHLMLFLDRFDTSSLCRHFPTERLSIYNFEEELRRRYVALHCIRRKEFSHPDLAGILATLYIMFLEDDGRNSEQIIWADLQGYLQQFIRDRLLDGASFNNGWPLENEVNTLAVILFWFITSNSCLSQETTQFGQDFISILSHYAYAGFRYPCFMEPEYIFYPRHEAKYAISSDGSYPPSRPSIITVPYFGEGATFNLPPVAPFAILGQFARLEQFPLKVPPELPTNRQEALASGLLRGPTKEDIVHFNAQCKIRFSGDYDKSFKSRSHDPDWYRSLSISHSTFPRTPSGFYTPGTFSGSWQGSFITPCRDVYQTILSSPDAPSTFPRFGRFPLYVHFREYFCYSPSAVPVMDDENAFFNAFLPEGCRWHEIEGGIEIIGKNNSFKAHYAHYNGQDEQCDLVTNNPKDIIIVGRTEEPYATAWNGYTYIGRIRPSDGLVVLVREPLEHQMAELGRALFRGYIISSCNFVGRWRNMSGEHPADWESIFSMSKTVLTR